MVNDPYKVLGIPNTATPDEIKKAYRKKAKENHPDLHQNDPTATSKMKEINEAYDMLQNPEKYESKRKQEAQRQTQNAAYRNNQGYQNYGNNRYQGAGNHGYQGPGGWSSDFGGFNFEDIFGFGETQYNTMPRAAAGDDPELVRAINMVNAGRYQDAISILMYMTSVRRNGRWYYVNAVAHYNCGDTARAQDMLQRAIQMEPNNKTYQWLFRQYRNHEYTASGPSYTQSNQSPLQTVGKIIVGAAVLQFVFAFMHMLFYGMMLPY